jgi:hypothetical protein
MMHRKYWNLTALLAILTISTGAVPITAVAQQPDSQATSKFAPIKAPSLTPDMLKAPAESLDTGNPPPKLKSSDKDLPAPKLPTDVNLGKYDLKFQAGQTSDVTPRTGFDSGELANIESILPGKPESVVPNYFGLKLSAPTR